MDADDIWNEFRSAMTPDRAAAWRAACLEVLRLSGLFDIDTYRTRLGQPDENIDLLADYHDRGWRLGLWPNPYFDPAWYRGQYPDVAAGDQDPLLHYVSYGEAEGRRPVAWFDPVWYRTRYAVPQQMHSLRHFLLHRNEGKVAPIPEFDSAWYLARYPDVAAAGMDPMEHYLVQGFREGRDPSPHFNTRFYRLRYLRGQKAQNPLLHYLDHREQPGVHPEPPAGEATIASEVRRFSAPGPDFEPVKPLPPEAALRAQILAFYLPQFHPVPENNAWWGEGFTEWTNIARALPRFSGHYQPRIPRDLGHYRLDDPASIARQITLARGAGLSGFVFYFYWFDGARLLETPLELLLSHPELNFPFCLMWANENWTRRWDGHDRDVLRAQTYARADEAGMIGCFARHFADPRYFRLQGRPVLMIYRAGGIPRTRATIARWRRIFGNNHGENPIFVMAQSFGDEDPRASGFDAAVEFPPHKLTAGLTLANPDLELLDHDFEAQVYHYDDIAAQACAQPPPGYPLIRTALPGWDNDARRQGSGMVIHGATPARYRRWLELLIAQARAEPVFGAPLVCVNAWNEWAEGAYLEPDQHFGAAFLNATGQAIAGARAADAGTRILLIGHDAFPSGAQLLLLHIARRLRAAHGATPHILLGAGGALEDAYRAAAPVQIVSNQTALRAAAMRLRQDGFSTALVNSAVSAWCCAILESCGIETTLLVHEMPGLIADRKLTVPLRAAASTAQHIVFPAAIVRDRVAEMIALPPDRLRILPQGVYQDLIATDSDAQAARMQWSIGENDLLVCGAGYGDHRKGFDLFLRVFELSAPARADLHMAWIGDLDPRLRHTLSKRLARAVATGRFHAPGWVSHIAPALRAADLFLLTSREDPYPSAALEALRLGAKIIAFAGSGGIAELLAGAAGQCVAMEDCTAMAVCVTAATRAATRENLLPQPHDFGHYAAELLRLARAPAPAVSVVIPCYQQAAFLPRRLDSIFAQAVPVHDLTLRDDASTDASAETAARHARAHGRLIDVIAAPRNSGSPFACWREAASQAAGDLLWIAEADDEADPALLASLLPFFDDPRTLLAFCDSRPIDRDGAALTEDYRASYDAAGGPGALAADATYDAAEFARRFLAERNILFNVSAILWRRAPLRAALDRLGDELLTWRVAGDWRLTIELLATTQGQVAHCARTLNAHRRDPASASARLSAGTHLAEICAMHRLIRAKLGAAPGLAARQRRYLAEAAAHLANTQAAVPCHARPLL